MNRISRSMKGSVMLEVAFVLPLILTIVFLAYSLFKVTVRDTYIANDVASSIGEVVRIRCGLLGGADLENCLNGIQKQVRDFGFVRRRNVDVNLAFFGFSSSGSCSLVARTSAPALGTTPSPYNCSDFSMPSPKLNVQPLASIFRGIFLIEVYVESPRSYFIPARTASKIIVI